MVNIGNDWDEILKDEFLKPYYLELRSFLKKEYASHRIFPDMYDIFNALKYTSFGDTKVVMIGQDPYHGEGQAHGLCFSVKPGIEPPPSLKNIFAELKSDLNVEVPEHYGYLTSWAKQGVLMLNSVLTVRAGQAFSHKGRGWETFTDRVILELNAKKTPVVFLLWGAAAKNKAQLITNKNHIKLTAAHPSPLSAYNGFFGCRHFSAANKILAESGQTPIDWSLNKEGVL